MALDRTRNAEAAAFPHVIVRATLSDVRALRDGSGSGISIDTDLLTPHSARLLRSDHRVIGFAPDVPTRLVSPYGVARQSTPEGDNWFLDAVGITPRTRTGKGVRVAILDTGVDIDHPAFSHVHITSRDFTGQGAEDENGHGTHCAGLMVGRDNANTFRGVAPDVDGLVNCKVLDRDGVGSSSSLLDGLAWCKTEKVHIASISLGFDFSQIVETLRSRGISPSASFSAGVSAYVSALKLFETCAAHLAQTLESRPGMLLVAAAGNESDREENQENSVGASCLSAADAVLAVGALERNPATGHSVANFSNHGVDVAAPGVGISAPRAGGGYIQMSGTSMATPIAAGVAAVWRSARPSGSLRVDQLRSMVIGNCAPVAYNPRVAPLADAGAGLVRVPSNT